MWINQTAAFECATNITEYTISFTLPAGISYHTETVDLEDAYGTVKVVARFTVTSGNNGTSVRCIADDGVNVPLYTKLEYAYAQGKQYLSKFNVQQFCQFIGLPSSVRELTAAQQDQCSLLLQWKPPFLLPGLSVSYKVYMNGEIIQNDVINTDYTYYPVDERLYNISIQAYYQLLFGNIATTMVNYQKGE